MKRFVVLLTLIGIILAASGCSDEATKPVSGDVGVAGQEASGETVAVSESSFLQGEINKIITSSEISEDVLSWHKVSKYEGDLDGDGTDEELVLSTTAECDKKGEFVWNDGQNWALYVVDGQESYLLFNEYISAGYPYFEVSDYYLKDDTVTVIDVVTTSGASFMLRGYYFSDTEKGYVENMAYNTKNITSGGINTRFSSFPEYQKEIK